MPGCFVILSTIMATYLLFSFCRAGLYNVLWTALIWYIPLLRVLYIRYMQETNNKKQISIELEQQHIDDIIKNLILSKPKKSIEISVECKHSSHTVRSIGEKLIGQLETSRYTVLGCAHSIIALNQYSSHFGVLDWQELSNHAERIAEAHQRAHRFHSLLLPNEYGKQNPELFKKIRDPNYHHYYSQIVFCAENMMTRISGLEFLKADISELDSALYYFAAHSLQHPEAYAYAQKAVRYYFYKYDKDSSLILIIADMLSASDLGKEALRLKNSSLRNEIKNYTPHGKAQLASALCAIGALDQELIILSEMYAAGDQMSSELQKRMAFLQTGALNTKSIYHEDAPGCTADTISIELESKGWSTQELAAFFQQLQYAGRNRPQYALELCGKSTTLTISNDEDEAFNRTRLSLSAMVNAIKLKCGTDCKWLNVKPIDNNPPRKGFFIEKNGISYFMCMSKDNCHVVFNQLAFCMPDHAVDEKHILNLKHDNSIEQTFIDMRAAIQLYLQTEVHKAIYVGNNKQQNSNQIDTEEQLY